MRVNGEEITVGLFERNAYQVSHDLIVTYDTEDYIAQKLMLKAYIVHNHKEMNKKLENLIYVLRSKVEKSYEDIRERQLKILEKD